MRVLAECYAIATPGGVQSRGYMRRMHDAWCGRGMERQVSEVNLANQLREIRKSGRLSSADVEAIRQQCTAEEPTRTETSPEASRDALCEQAVATGALGDRGLAGCMQWCRCFCYWY